MFENYENSEKIYELQFPDGTVLKNTTQELYEFFIFNGNNFIGNFDEFKKKLDNGQCVVMDVKEWDWGMGCNINKGKIKIIRTMKTILNKISSLECKHENKYINQAGGIRFWVCPKCKKDLGDA